MYSLAGAGSNKDQKFDIDINAVFKKRLISWATEEAFNATNPALAPLQNLQEVEKSTTFKYVLLTLSEFSHSARREVSEEDAVRLKKDIAENIRRQEFNIAALAAPQVPGQPKIRLKRVKWLPIVKHIVGVCQEIIDCLVRKRLKAVNFDLLIKLVHLLNIDLSPYFDVLGYDEAQDVPPVMIEITCQQPKCAVIAIGDGWQEINGWAGTKNALEAFAKRFDPSKTYRYILPETFRFGTNVVDLVNIYFDHLAKLEVPMKTSVKHQTSVECLPMKKSNTEGTVVDLAAVAKQAIFKSMQSASKYKRARSSQQCAILARKRQSLLGFVIELAKLHQLMTAANGYFTWSCCASIKTVITKYTKLCKVNRGDLKALLAQAEENEDYLTETLIRELIANAPSSNRSFELQQLMNFYVADPHRCRLYICTTHSAKGEQYPVEYVLPDFDSVFLNIVEWWNENRLAKQEQKKNNTKNVFKQSKISSYLKAVTSNNKEELDSLLEEDEKQIEFVDESKDSDPLENSRKRFPKGEICCLYVTITRAQDELILPPKLFEFYQTKTFETFITLESDEEDESNTNE